MSETMLLVESSEQLRGVIGFDNLGRQTGLAICQEAEVVQAARRIFEHWPNTDMVNVYQVNSTKTGCWYIRETLPPSTDS